MKSRPIKTLIDCTHYLFLIKKREKGINVGVGGNDDYFPFYQEALLAWLTWLICDNGQLSVIVDPETAFQIWEVQTG